MEPSFKCDRKFSGEFLVQCHSRAGGLTFQPWCVFPGGPYSARTMALPGGCSGMESHVVSTLSRLFLDLGRRSSHRVDRDQCIPQHEHKPSPKRLYLQLPPPTRISAPPPATTSIIPAPVISHRQSPSLCPPPDRSLRLQGLRLVRPTQSEKRWEGSLCQ